jgi:hypothetical protein
MSKGDILLGGAVFAGQLVVAPRVPDQDRPNLHGCPIPGARLDTCVDCLAYVWIVPAIMVAALSLPVVCTFCFGAGMDNYAARRPGGIGGRERLTLDDGTHGPGCTCVPCVDRLSVACGIPLTPAMVAESGAKVARDLDRAKRRKVREAIRKERKRK